jgi:uncharacterized membrane protein YqaE (UPF0057 family)
MKTKILFSALIAAFLLASCGIMKNDDFTSKKYTHFKKGESTVSVTPNTEYVAVASQAEDIQPTETASTNTFAETVASNSDIQNIKEPAVTKTIQQKIFVSRPTSKKEKIQRTANFIMNRLTDKANTASTSEAPMILLIILCFLLPPLAVFLARGIGNEFWISLLLTILFWIPGVIYSLLVVCDAI